MEPTTDALILLARDYPVAIASMLRPCRSVVNELNRTSFGKIVGSAPVVTQHSSGLFSANRVLYQGDTGHIIDYVEELERKKPEVVTQRQYWLVASNVMKDSREQAVETWKREIVYNRVAIIGWPRGTPRERRFRTKVQPRDVVLIARCHRGEPDPVAVGIVKGESERRQFPHIDRRYV